MTSITERALLVSVGISQWDARRIDKAETYAVETKHKTRSKAVRVHKSLLPGAKELEAIHKMTGEIRTFVYKRTLPWGEGVQILRTSGYIEFTQELDALRSQWHAKVNEFVMAYPQLVQDAQYSLGTLFDGTDYPDCNDLREKFVIDVKYLPVPEANDWRVDLGDEQLVRLRESVEKQVRASTEAAMKDAWDRLFKVAEHAHERLSNPKAVFRDSLIDNAIEVCSLLPSLNITGDSNLEKMRQSIERSLCAHDPRTLRKDGDARAEAARKMKQAMDKMSSMYGC